MIFKQFTTDSLAAFGQAKLLLHPDVRNHNDSKQIRHTIKIPDMRAFYIEPAGFQAFE